MFQDIQARIKSLNWESIQNELDEQGFAKLPAILTKEECDYFIELYSEEGSYRTTINMTRYRFGNGEYKYFSYPLPEAIQRLRESFYPELSKTANRWLGYLKKPAQFPDNLQEFLKSCEEYEQTRPTPLILKYEKGGFNCLHQDLYGDVFFPFQVVFVLNQRDKDYTGGESLLVEQIPRAQSRAHVITLEQGGALIFPTNHRPSLGKKGYYKNTVRHGVSTVTTGERYGLGIIFHDSK
ncbi:2OG-Fe(II) oxygenase [Cytobacillus solani]|uniref:Prolyl 4-hydroxylase subunit alpha n=1 Tax=Cytobacillus solani TaxID=1637975 RepID=A0A0Q3VFV3_9BACI|nr:2OG-Fe(II) oxygenase [Cytobacillus solani]KOP81172.1 prolyl 4-hydroxylase subunit alpha [Bacillus sp. FJAT-21945]KQL18186.1 prolyl 4-hydroxylase subunit alpha [Cytobacillus solani]USK56025.1 2OG-Fe(II) oxygenase [Cytobacillus solani]